MISRSFSADEFDCHDGTCVPVSLLPNLSRLVHTVLQPLRKEWGAPIIIVSGYRSAAWNERVGGAKRSTHLTMDAADVRTVRIEDIPDLLEALLVMLGRPGALAGLGGLGIYPRWLHLDTRKASDGHLRRWTGSGVGSEPES